MDSSIDYSKIPSATPPEGVTPNFINPESNANVATIVCSILLPLTLILVSFRAYFNFWCERKRKLSDYLCLLAMAASISYISVMYLTISQHIIGRHMWDVPVSMNTNSSVQNFMVLAILYGPAIFLAKLTVLLLYLEIFTVNTKTRSAVFIAIFIITAQLLANTIGNAILCVPLPGQSWQLKDNTHACRVIADRLGVALGGISVFTDFFIIAIPIPAIWRLQLATRKKVGVCMIFVTGILACVASIIALVFRIRQYRVGDNTWISSYTFMLCAVEINVTIMCSCMPSFAPYTRKSLQSFSIKLRSLSTSISRILNRSSRSYSNSLNNQPVENGSPRLEEGVVVDDKMRLTLGSAVGKGEKMGKGGFLGTVQERRKEVWEERSEEGEERSVNNSAV